LAWQFPEAAKFGLDATLFWGWLAGERKAIRYDNLIAQTVGLGLASETRASTKAICELQRRERILELSMRSLMKDLRFAKGKNSGQPTKRHLSRRRFQKAL
jgi:hypothetical protein